VAAALAKNPDFLGKCPICGPTHDALTEYGKLTIQPTAKEAKGLPEELVTRLQSDKTETRHAALRELVQRYIECEYVRLELTPEQRTALHKELEKMRELGMGGLRTRQKFCPSCDGHVVEFKSSEISSGPTTHPWRRGRTGSPCRE
jgi:hypothetical protein